MKKTSWPSQTDDKATIVEAPGGYKFHLVAEDTDDGNVMFFTRVLFPNLVYFNKLSPKVSNLKLNLLFIYFPQGNIYTVINKLIKHLSGLLFLISK